MATTEPLDLNGLAEDLAKLGGLMPEQVPGLRMVLEAVDEAAYGRGHAAGRAAVARELAMAGELGAMPEIEALRARVLELQRELGERNMADDREKADTTVGAADG